MKSALLNQLDIIYGKLLLDFYRFASEMIIEGTSTYSSTAKGYSGSRYSVVTKASSSPLIISFKVDNFDYQEYQGGTIISGSISYTRSYSSDSSYTSNYTLSNWTVYSSSKALVGSYSGDISISEAASDTAVSYYWIKNLDILLPSNKQRKIENYVFYYLDSSVAGSATVAQNVYNASLTKSQPRFYIAEFGYVDFDYDSSTNQGGYISLLDKQCGFAILGNGPSIASLIVKNSSGSDYVYTIKQLNLGDSSPKMSVVKDSAPWTGL